MRYLQTILLFLVGTVALAAPDVNEQAQTVPSVALGNTVIVSFYTQNGDTKSPVILLGGTNVAPTSYPFKCSYPTDDWLVVPGAGARQDKATLLLEQSVAQIEISHFGSSPLPARFVLKCITRSRITTVTTTIVAQPPAQESKSDTSPIEAAAPGNFRPAPARTTRTLAGIEQPVRVPMTPIWVRIVIATLAIALLGVLYVLRLFRTEAAIMTPRDKCAKLEPGKEFPVKIKRPRSSRVRVTSPRPVQWRESQDWPDGQNQRHSSDRKPNQNREYFSGTLSLDPLASSGAEVVEFTVERRFFPPLKLEVFLWWEGAKDLSDEKIPGMQPTISWHPKEVSGQIRELQSQLQLQAGALSMLQQSAKLIERAVAKVSEDQIALYPSEELKQLNTSLATLTEKINDSPEHLLLVVNQAFAKSIGLVQKQIKEGADSQLRYLAGLVNPNHKDHEHPEARSGNGGSQIARLESLFPEKVIGEDIASRVRSFTSSPSSDGMNLRTMAQNFGNLAVAIAEIESRFDLAGRTAPPLVGQIRGRLLRLQWLAQKYDSFRRNQSLPVEVRLECTEEGLQKLPNSIAEGLETALQYWQLPKEFLEKNWDEVVTREVTELVMVCDRAAQDLNKPGLFDDLLRKLFDITHLEDISPRPGGAYDSAGHIILGFEPGNRDTVTRVVVRGFRYKQGLLQKSTVMIGQ